MLGYSYNITFVVSPSSEGLFLDWARSNLLTMLFNSESPARNAALRKIIEAGGKKPDDDHGVSIALHSEFDTEKNAREWHDAFLAPALGKFTATFGPDAVFFVTLLENIPL